MERFVSMLGLRVILLLAWLLSENRRRMNVRLIVSGLALEFLLAVILLWTAPGQQVFLAARAFVARVISFSDAGAEFVFGAGFREHFFAFSVLPTLIFVSAVSAMLFHLGIMQWIVRAMAWGMVRVMDTSGTESLAASLMAAPGSLVIAKIMVPETERSLTKGVVRIDVPREDVNVLDAACRGATDGLKLALNVGAVLIAFIGIIFALNWLLSFASIGGEPLTLERMLGWLFSPLALVMGVEWKDAHTVGMLLGKKTVLNEFLAYSDLMQLKEQLSPRSLVIATYALCGFANFGSVAIQIGGISTLAPSRRADFARFGLRAMIGGSLATFMTATIAGMLI